jgi:hypothetical protein
MMEGGREGGDLWIIFHVVVYSLVFPLDLGEHGFLVPAVF